MFNKYRISCATAALALLCMAIPALSRTMDAPTISRVKANSAYIEVQFSAGPAGAPEGFVVEWMLRNSFDLLGGWPSDPASPEIRRAVFTGVPTLHAFPDGADFLLNPDISVSIVPGELFDETGVAATDLNELTPATGYVIRARAVVGGSTTDGPTSANLYTSTSPRSFGCTYTQGYWKNHPSAWPVLNVTLGTVTYNQTQLLNIFNQPAAGNGLLILAHQLIAAKLNIAFGADPTVALPLISAADAMVGGLVCPPVGGGSLSPGATSSLTNSLDDFNTGTTGPGHCGTSPARPSSWGSLRRTYR